MSQSPGSDHQSSRLTCALDAITLATDFAPTGENETRACTQGHHVAGRTKRRAEPKLSHQAVRKHLLDYHVGRLSPEMSAAVERHVRTCSSCQAEGLVHLATERRAAIRIARRSSSRRSNTNRPRLLALAATLVLLALLIVILTTSKGAGLPWNSAPASGAQPTTTAPTVSPARPSATHSLAPTQGGSLPLQGA
jgi:hypothetical protein